MAKQEERESRDGDDLWLDRWARMLGFGWVADQLPWDLPVSYVYGIVVVTVPNLATAAYNLHAGVPLLYQQNPYYLLEPVLLLAAVYGARTLSADYDRVMSEMAIAERTSDPDRLLSPIPDRLPWGLFIVALVIQYIPTPVWATWGLAGYVDNLIVLPWLFTPIVVQFFIVYLSIEFIAPWRLANSDVGIHFLDPQGVGGLRPLGELIKRAYYFVVVGLVGYALITYAPLVPGWTTSGAANVVFTVLWVLTVATVGFAVYTLHRFMHREKRGEIQRLESRLRALLENPWQVGDYRVPDGNQEEVSDLRERINQVAATKEYPATFSIWSQLLVSIALPKAAQLVIAGV